MKCKHCGSEKYNTTVSWDKSGDSVDVTVDCCECDAICNIKVKTEKKITEVAEQLWESLNKVEENTSIQCPFCKTYGIPKLEKIEYPPEYKIYGYTVYSYGYIEIEVLHCEGCNRNVLISISQEGIEV